MRQRRIATSRNALIDRYAIFVLTTDHLAVLWGVFGGDFRQIPHGVRHGSSAQVAPAWLKRTPLRRQAQALPLSRHMRLSEGEDDLAIYLIRAGGGLEVVFEGEGKIEPPAEMWADATKMTDATDEVGRWVSPDLTDRNMDGEYLMGGDLLGAKNEDVDAINGSIIRPTGESLDMKALKSPSRKASKTRIQSNCEQLGHIRTSAPSHAIEDRYTRNDPEKS